MPQVNDISWLSVSFFFWCLFFSFFLNYPSNLWNLWVGGSLF